ncbi:MAG: DUF1538 domain-containing protein [Gracilibacteraceae bacterium]|jgi:hypothetical protein|nr:DUF1538 domain-containing protein [Gracilibacteraceae bacterium]
MKKNLYAKIRESLAAVLPVTLIVLILSVTLVPMTGEMVFMFLVGAAMLIAGVGLFTLGADNSMILMGEKIGAGITRTRKLPLIIFSCLIIGIFITVAEPDLRVLAEQAPIVENTVLIVSVAVGVGIFLLIAFLRIFFQIKLSLLLVIFYIAVFALALSPLIPGAFIPVAFDSGGVTTGPITVPFILALGLGLAKIRGDKSSEDDTFGLVALCSIGPILTVLVLGALSGSHDVNAEIAAIDDYQDVRAVFREFLVMLPHYLEEVFFALLPIVALCAAFRLFIFKLGKHETLEVLIGFGLTFLGLVLFLTGVNIGFMPVGIHLGRALAASELKWLLPPLGALIGYFIVAAEPAVHVLKEQVQDVTQGRISGKSLGRALSIGVAASVGLAMLRILTGVELVWFLIPGYAFSLLMTRLTPGIFTAIAFDSGGVASGPMTATFLLPFAMGACAGVGGDMARDAFGVVAMVAMTPLITIQLLGLTARLKLKPRPAGLEALDEILDLSEVA